MSDVVQRALRLSLALVFFFPGQLPAAPPPEVSTRETAVTQVVRGDETKNPYQVTGESLVLLLGRMVDFTAPGSSVVFERRSGQLFIKQTPGNHVVIEKILGDLRRAAFRQVEIEARFVTVSSQDFKGIGVDFAGLNAALSKSGVILGTAAMGGPAAIAPTLGSFTDTSFLDFTDVTGFGDTPLGGTLSFFGRSSKVDFRAVYDALESMGQVNTLSSPKIVVFNNQRAHIRIERIQNYVAEINSSLINNVGGTSGVAVAVVQTEATIGQARSGTLLDVTPTVNQDGTITLELHPQFVTVDLDNSQDITNVTGGDTFDNSVTLPVFKSQEIDTTVTIPDGGFAVMGGLIQDSEVVTKERTPFFGKIPYVRWAFSNEQTKRSKSYLLIFVQARRKGFVSHEKAL